MASGSVRIIPEVFWLCIVQPEIDAAVNILDGTYERWSPSEKESYILGRIGDHEVAIAHPPSGTYGTIEAAYIAAQIPNRFPNVRFGLLVGVAGGCPDLKNPEKDIRLGDVVVSRPRKEHGGVLQIDMGQRTDQDGFKIQSHLDKPPRQLRNAITALQIEHGNGKRRRMDGYLDDLRTRPELARFLSPGSETDRLFNSNYPHADSLRDCSYCDLTCTVQREPRGSHYPRVHYGTIASGNVVMKSATERNRLRDAKDVYCFEMEAAGVMDSFPFLVIRGICDYSDSHKNKNWQPYAAFAAAAYAKDLLECVPKAPVVIRHVGNCFIGSVPAKAVEKALQSQPKGFRRELQAIVEQVVTDYDADFVTVRLPRYQRFLEKYGLQTAKHWDGRLGDLAIFDQFNLAGAKQLLTAAETPPQQRLHAARAHAFILSNWHGQTARYIVYNTLLQLWDYMESVLAQST